MKIDSHQHFWNYNADHYGWMTEEHRVIKHDFLPADIDPLLVEAGIDGCIAVQARQTVGETQWLLKLSDQYSKIKGVVGWLPLSSPEIESSLDRFADHPKLVGIRHIVHDEEDDDYILRADFNRGIRALEPRDLVYDILIYEKHLPQAIQFVDRHPNIQFVVDHIAKPKIKADAFDEGWRTNIIELGRRKQVACKLSGMVTEVRDPQWNEDLLKPYFQTVLNAFGPDRLLYGSDWPVCLLRSGYAQWHQAVLNLIASLSANEQSEILGVTACRIYKL